MELNPRLWYVQWFFWSCRVLQRFCSTRSSAFFHREYRYRNGTNLCHFFRTLLWGTLIFLGVIGLYAYAIFAFLVLPFMLFSYLSVLTVVGVIVGVLALTACVIAIVHLVVKMGTWLVKRHPKPSRPSDQPRFAKVVRSYWTAIHDRICPLIKFRGTTL